ncbi:MAG: nucleoside monophosphate kinase, partial [Erysipelotrichaceae bacterium]|nr:nucleoside monophosphate kinase [Erysipelotrichaceae bacterium]
MNLLIIGAPGAGKGTMSDLLINTYHLVHVSTGDMLRAAVKAGTPVGLKAQEYMNKGALVPDEVIHDIIVERLSQDDIKAGFLFDGYPRTIAQAQDLDLILKEIGLKIDDFNALDFGVRLAVPDAEGVGKVRLQCLSCLGFSGDAEDTGIVPAAAVRIQVQA